MGKYSKKIAETEKALADTNPMAKIDELKQDLKELKEGLSNPVLSLEEKSDSEALIKNIEAQIVEEENKFAGLTPEQIADFEYTLKKLNKLLTDLMEREKAESKHIKKITEVDFPTEGLTEDMVGRKFIHKTNTYRNDESGNVIEEMEFDKDRMVSKTIYKYDVYGNMIEGIQQFYRADGDIAYKITLQYEYDLSGNWITRTHYMGRKLFVTTKREIEYY